MRLMPSFHWSYPDVRAARTALAAGAVAGLIVIAACTDSASRAVTAPPSSARGAVIAAGGFGQAKFLNLCVDASAPTGNYTFKNIALDLSRVPANPGYSEPLDGNGFWDGVYWNDKGDGGTGTTQANAGLNVPYIISHTNGSPGDCLQVLTRVQGDLDFAKNVPPTCDPNTQSCKQSDSFAAANILFVSASNGYIYDKTDCLVDDGDLMPQHITNAVGNPSPWPDGGFNSFGPHPNAFETYSCGTGNNPTRGFVNYEHGTTLTFFFKQAPILSACTSGPDGGGAAGAAYYNLDNARTRAAFNESEVLTGFAVDNGVLHGWYTDEHAMTLGVDSIYVNNKNPTPDAYYGIFNNPSAYAIEKMSNNPTSSTTASATGSPFILTGRNGTSSPPLGLGNAVDPAGRALRPGLYITDLTTNGVNSKIGDWQMGNDNPVSPTAIYGTWKGAIITIDNTKNPAVTSLVNRADPSKNHKNVGPGGLNPPLAAADFGYSTDNQWNLATLVSQGILVTGRAYRAQFIVHDGDQNKTGGDVGQACINIQM